MALQAPAEPASARMQAMFRTTTRANDTYVDHGGLRLDELIEVELKPEYSVQDLIATGVNLESFREIYEDKVVWMNATTCISSFDQFQLDDFPLAMQCTIDLEYSGIRLAHQVYTLNDADGDMTSTGDLLQHLARSSGAKTLTISSFCHGAPFAMPGPVLAQFLAVPSIKEVTLVSFADLEEEHVSKVRALVPLFSSVYRPMPAFVNQEQDLTTLASGLPGNSRLESLTLEVGLRIFEHGSVDALFRGLGENLGLRTLRLAGLGIVSDDWMTLWASLKDHPTVKEVDLKRTASRLPTPLTSADKMARTRALADMLAENKVLERIELSENERNEGIYQTQIVPCLERNIFLPRLTKIKKCKSESLRRGLLGRSFSRFEGNANLIWMFLSENADVAFPNQAELAGKRKRG